MTRNQNAELQLPIIDVSLPDTQVAKEILSAASTYGFVFVKGYEEILAKSSVDGMFSVSRQFFSRPKEEKEQVSINSAKSGKNRGWLSMHMETLDPGKQKRGDFKEAFNIGEYRNDKPQQPLIPPLSEAAMSIGSFQSQCHRLCNRILELFATGLDISDLEGGREWFSLRHDQSKGPSGSILRLLYVYAAPPISDGSELTMQYPTLPPSYNAETDIRAGAHSDYGSVTLLFQLPGQPGLEILTPTQSWAPVPVVEDAVLVNIGDLLSYWTNGLLKSTVHRVIGPSDASERYSIAYFCHPIDDALLVPVPSTLVQAAGEQRGRQEGEGNLTAKGHLDGRLAATYGLKK